MPSALHSDAFCLWKPRVLDILERLQKGRILVNLLLSRGVDGESDCEHLKGRILKVSGNVAVFSVEQRETTTPVNPAVRARGSIVGEMSFTLTEGGDEGMLHTTEADILQAVFSKDKAPSALSLRVSGRIQIRRMRRDVRLDWPEGVAALTGVDIIDKIPQTSPELRVALSQCLQNRDTSPEIVNISAGGVCLLVEKKIAATTLSATDYILFVFALKAKQKSVESPNFLLCKKVGLRRDIVKAEKTAVRLRYLYEFNSATSSEGWQWRNIEQTGSDALRHIISYLAEFTQLTRDV
ncbi:MAG: hypothetical protein K6F46_09395 [Desulfovibrio sp.]|nr:hypothetical protein [Desulfovibrio sp.]